MPSFFDELHKKLGDDLFPLIVLLAESQNWSYEYARRSLDDDSSLDAQKEMRYSRNFIRHRVSMKNEDELDACIKATAW